MTFVRRLYLIKRSRAFYSCLISCGLIFFTLTGCQPTTPTLTELSPVGGFGINNRTQSLATTNFVVTASGSCSAAFTDVFWSTDNGVSWASISTLPVGYQVLCATSGTWSATIDLSNSGTVLTSLLEQIPYVILFRGQSQYGPSASVSLLILPAVSTPVPMLYSGVANNGNTIPAPKFIIRGGVGGLPLVKTFPSKYVLYGQIHMRSK